jgi:DNA modification methylase
MTESFMELPLFLEAPAPLPARPAHLAEELEAFKEFGKLTRKEETSWSDRDGHLRHLPAFINEFWTSKQRAASNLHEISYRACFKPQLPRFFISRLTRPGDRVYDPFMGRGTTLLEAALMGRIPLGCDVNPLSALLIRPRLAPPTLEHIERRLAEIDFQDAGEMPEDLLVFYHPETLRQISALRKYLLEKERRKRIDPVDDWIRLVGLNRLTGHSKGFFSVYTMPPNQAVSVKSQRKINERRRQTPPIRNVSAIILKKSRQLLADCQSLERQRLDQVRREAALLTGSAARTPELAAGTVDLVVTSPPFLNVVDYAGDNWLRCWFVGVDPKTVQLTVPAKLADWKTSMTEVFHELHRVLKPGGHVAFEVGEVLRGSLKLEDAVLPCGHASGLEPELVLINDQTFTKTANCWGVDNNVKGTNSNRIVLFQKRPAFRRKR